MSLGKIWKEIGAGTSITKGRCVTTAILSRTTNYGLANVFVNGKRICMFGIFVKDEHDLRKATDEIKDSIIRLLNKGVILEKDFGDKKFEDINKGVMLANNDLEREMNESRRRSRANEN